ncbi:hypothetical protein Tco_0492204 [Tanacetum coccineum]
MAFLEDNRDTVISGQASQEIPTLAVFQTDDLDAFDSNCDEAPSASDVLIAKLSAYDSDILLEVPTHDTYLDNQVIDQSVQVMQYSKQLVFDNDTNIEITSKSNIISYEQYLKETENAVVQNTSSFAQQDALMPVIEEMSNQIAKCNEVDKVIVENNAKVADFENQIHSLKLQVNATVESHKTLSTTVDVLKKEYKAKEDKYLKEIIGSEKQKKSLDNVVYKMGQSTQTMHIKVPALYYGRTTVKQHDALSIIDTKETLELAKESRLKMHAKQNDPIAKDKKVNIIPIDYAALNKLYSLKLYMVSWTVSYRFQMKELWPFYRRRSNLERLLENMLTCFAPGICLLAWMGWNANIEGRGLGELCTFDKMF